MKHIIIIKKNGTIISKSLQNVKNVSNVTITHKDVVSLFNTNIKKSINFKNNFKRYCDWELEDSVISLFGSKEGRAGSENKYDLPPPEDIDIYFGEILMVKSVEDVICDLTRKDFNDFIEVSFGGFENLGINDTEEEYDPELDRYESDFVVPDNEVEYEEGYNPEEEEEEEYKSSTNEEEEEEEYKSSTNEEEDYNPDEEEEEEEEDDEKDEEEDDEKDECSCCSDTDIN